MKERRRFEEGLNTKVKLYIYKRFGKNVEFKKYLHGVWMQEVDFYLSLSRVRMV